MSPSGRLTPWRCAIHSKTVCKMQNHRWYITSDTPGGYTSVGPEHMKSLKYKASVAQPKNTKPSGGPWASRRTSIDPRLWVMYAKLTQRTPWRTARTSLSSFASKFPRCNRVASALAARLLHGRLATLHGFQASESFERSLYDTPKLLANSITQVISKTLYLKSSGHRKRLGGVVLAVSEAS